MRYIALTYLICFTALAGYSQEYEYTAEEIYRSPIRKILNQFSITVTSGYNSTNYSHNLSGYYLLQSQDQQYITEDLGVAPVNNAPVYQNWLNKPELGLPVVLEDTFELPYPPLANPVLNPLLVDGFRAYDADSLGLGFEGTGWSIPLNLSVRYNYEKFRIGGGISMALHKVRSLDPTVSGIGIRAYEPDFGTAFFFRYYGQLGYRFYDFWDYSFAGEVEIGKHKMGSKYTVSNGVYVNLGLSIEKNLSEYARVIFKPSYDIKKYTVSVPGPGPSIEHKNPSWNFSLGISITIPEIPRSPIKSDHVQLKHVITDPTSGRYTEVRGQSIWKKQNPKVGQNHRKLWRYKNRNKRKINPY